MDTLSWTEYRKKKEEDSLDWDTYSSIASPKEPVDEEGNEILQEDINRLDEVVEEKPKEPDAISKIGGGILEGIKGVVSGLAKGFVGAAEMIVGGGEGQKDMSTSEKIGIAVTGGFGAAYGLLRSQKLYQEKPEEQKSEFTKKTMAGFGSIEEDITKFRGESGIAETTEELTKMAGYAIPVFGEASAIGDISSAIRDAKNDREMYTSIAKTALNYGFIKIPIGRGSKLLGASKGEIAKETGKSALAMGALNAPFGTFSAIEEEKDIKGIIKDTAEQFAFGAALGPLVTLGSLKVNKIKADKLFKKIDSGQGTISFTPKSGAESLGIKVEESTTPLFDKFGTETDSLFDIKTGIIKYAKGKEDAVHTGIGHVVYDSLEASLSKGEMNTMKNMVSREVKNLTPEWVEGTGANTFNNRFANAVKQIQQNQELKNQYPNLKAIINNTYGINITESPGLAKFLTNKTASMVNEQEIVGAVEGVGKETAKLTERRLGTKAPEITTPTGGVATAIKEPQITGTPSKVGVGIEAKTIEKGLAKDFGELAGYDKITIKGQAEKAAKLMNDDIDNAVNIALGKAPLPQGLKSATMIKAIEEHALTQGDSELLRKLAKSPLVSETSEYAQNLRLLAERNPDSPVAKFKNIVDARIKNIERTTGNTLDKEVEKDTMSMKSSIKKPSSKDWESFINNIRCK